jgi:hypothetical protein
MNNETKNYIYVVFDEDNDEMTVFRSKLHAVQYMVKRIKEWGYHYFDDENIKVLSRETEEKLNEIFFDFFTFYELFIMD